MAYIVSYMPGSPVDGAVDEPGPQHGPVSARIDRGTHWLPSIAGAVDGDLKPEN
jgi:hypothetical protein